MIGSLGKRHCRNARKQGARVCYDFDHPGSGGSPYLVLALFNLHDTAEIASVSRTTIAFVHSVRMGSRRFGGLLGR